MLEAWRRRIESEAEGSELRSLLERLLTELDAGAEPERIDGELDETLLELVPAALRQAVEAEARSWLDAHRSSMSKGDFERATRRAATVRLRRRLRLPRLAH